MQIVHISKIFSFLEVENSFIFVEYLGLLVEVKESPIISIHIFSNKNKLSFPMFTYFIIKKNQKTLFYFHFY